MAYISEPLKPWVPHSNFNGPLDLKLGCPISKSRAFCEI